MLVRVEWWDPASPTPSWISRDEAEDFEPCAVVTVGTILRRTRRVLVIAATIGAHGQVADVTAIPIGCVRRVRRLR